MEIAEKNAVLGFVERSWWMIEGVDTSNWPRSDQQRAVAYGAFTLLRRPLWFSLVWSWDCKEILKIP